MKPSFLYNIYYNCRRLYLSIKKRIAGLEPAALAWKAKVLPLYDIRTPQVGFEPTTNRLTADRSTPELLRIFLTSKLQCTDLVQVNNLDGSFKIITKRLKTNKCVFDH